MGARLLYSRPDRRSPDARRSREHSHLCGSGRLGPYNNITRAQVVTMSVRAASRNLPASATAVSVTQRWNAEEWEAVRKLLATSECSSR